MLITAAPLPEDDVHYLVRIAITLAGRVIAGGYDAGRVANKAVDEPQVFHRFHVTGSGPGAGLVLAKQARDQC